MRELLPDLVNWLDNGEPVALATVVSTWGSAPRPVGSYMAVNAKGKIAGSVSGGCVEGAVVDAAIKLLGGGKAELLHFGVADETAWNVGLACGGKIDVLIQTLDAHVGQVILSQLDAEKSVTIASAISASDEAIGGILVYSEDEVLYCSPSLKTLELSSASFSDKDSNTRPVHPFRFDLKMASQEDVEFLVNPILPSPTLIMIGGVHIAIALAEIARSVDFRTVIIDPRRAFGSKERFGHADQLIQAYPGEAFEALEINASTAIASLSHDPKIDDPALLMALESPAFYIGALGSNKTQKRRINRLAKNSVSAEALQRILGPVGLDIGAVTPEEIALAIMAQVIEAYRA